MTFAKNLRAIRAALGLSQSELAKRCGLQPSAIAHFESARREPSLSNFIKIKRALGATYDALLKE